MSLNDKTPKTMEEAIARGMKEWTVYIEWTPSHKITKTPEDFIRAHVQDFEANKFCATMFEFSFADRVLEILWNKIFGPRKF